MAPDLIEILSSDDNADVPCLRLGLGVVRLCDRAYRDYSCLWEGKVPIILITHCTFHMYILTYRKGHVVHMSRKRLCHDEMLLSSVPGQWVANSDDALEQGRVS